jgi:hypothetical protein
MNDDALRLFDVIKVLPRFQRSVNLEKDFWGRTDSNGYIVSLSAQKALRFILDGLQGEGAYRSITLTGPYGVGKSSFALFLTRLLCGKKARRDEASEKLRVVNPSLLNLLSSCISSNGKGRVFLPVLITSRRVSASLCILQGLTKALLSIQNEKLQTIGKRLENQIRNTESSIIDSRLISNELEMIAQTVVGAGFGGLLLIIDELGKLFEYAARDPKKGDVYVLQEIAEQAVRSDSAPVLMLGLLHQGFDEYAKHLDISTRQEWAKIQGRFTDIAFQEPTEQLIRLIACAVRKDDTKVPSGLALCLRKIADIAVSCGVSPPGMSAEEFRDLLWRCYPLHPATLVALPILFKRFAQNERSLFSYLTSLEPKGFQDFLKKWSISATNPSLVRLADLFDYFIHNFGPGLYRHPQARRWLEAADALDRKADLTETHRSIVKTIGVLSAMGEFSHLQATEAAIACAVDDTDRFHDETRKIVDDLKQHSILTYRRFNNTYRVWEGSDIDIEQRISEGIRKVGRSGFAAILKAYLGIRPLVARRHSFETGALRYFELAYIDDPDDIANYKRADARADGTIIVCLSQSGTRADEFRKRAHETLDRKDIIFAIPQQIGDLYSASVELAALRWTWDHTPQLRDDRVARREVALRITESENLLSRNLSRLQDPRPEPEGSSCLWFWDGKEQEVGNRSDVLQLLSRICDVIYHKAPTIRNELVTRRSLSSAAAAARRNLIEAMITKANLPLLGISGYPPERSMYESVLRQTGIHAEREPNVWGFQPPNQSNSHNVRAAWDHFYFRVFEGQTEPIELDRLFLELASPPFGVLEGLHPLLLCAFMQVYADETTLYREGTFIPEPSIVDFEVILRRPELFAILGARIEGEKEAILKRFAAGLNTAPATVPVVRELFKIVKGLPEFAWKTRKLPRNTLKLRAAFENARSPEQFLFDAIPEALGVDGISGSDTEDETLERFFEAFNTNLQNWSQAGLRAIKRAREVLLASCGLTGEEKGWRKLHEQSLKIEPFVTDTRLLNFVRRVISAGSDPDAGDTVLAIVANRPPDKWTDTDVDGFPAAAKRIGRAFFRTVQEEHLSLERPLSIQDLPVQERPRAQAFLEQLRKELKTLSKDVSKDVLRAVVVELSKEFDRADKENSLYEQNP